jgi:hypothetical protein
MIALPKGFSVKRTFHEATQVATLEFSFQASIGLGITADAELDTSYAEWTYESAIKALAQNVIREMQEYK